jgi:hypothetical protein
MLRSGKLPPLARVSADLLRHYERIGILPPPSRSSNAYRLYAPQMVERVRAVRMRFRGAFRWGNCRAFLGYAIAGGFPAGVPGSLPGKNYTASSRPSRSGKPYAGNSREFSVTGMAGWLRLRLASGRAFLNRSGSSLPH